MKEKVTRYLILLFSVVMLMAGVVSMETPAEAATRYRLNKTSISLQRGTSYQLKTNYKGKVKWASKNRRVAVVSSRGKVTAKGRGTTYITCRIGKKTLKCKVRVFTARMSASRKTIYVNRNYQLSVKGYRAAGWRSSDRRVATVSRNGLVTGRKAGVARIYAYVGNSRLTCTVTVKKAASKPSRPESADKEKKPEYSYSLHILNNYKIYAQSGYSDMVLYIKTDNPDPERILVGTSGASYFEDVKYTGDAAGETCLSPVEGGYIVFVQPQETGQQTLTLWEMYKGADKTWYYYGMPERIACKAASVSFYAYDSKEGYRQFVDEIIEAAKKRVAQNPEYTTGKYKDLSENEKILLDACDYVLETCTYPCNSFGYRDNWSYVHTLKKYGAWWDTREVDSMSGPQTLMNIATKLGATKVTQLSGSMHAYVDVTMNGHEYKALSMTPYMTTGAVNPDEIEYFDFSKFN